MVAEILPLVREDGTVEHTLACTLQGNDILVDYLAKELASFGAGSRVAITILGVIRQSIGKSVIRVMPSDLERLAVIGDEAAAARLKDHLYRNHSDFGRAIMQCLLALKGLGPADHIAPNMGAPIMDGVTPYRPLLDVFTVTYALLAGCTFDARGYDA